MTSYGYQDPGKSVPSDDRTVKLVETSRSDYTQENYGRSWSSQESEHDRSGKLEEISWDKFYEVDLLEEPLLGGNAHSERYGELTLDRSEKLVSVRHHQLAYSENFVMGSDAAEFVNKVKGRVRNRQNVERCRVR